MGTRADFYVGRGATAEWIGSVGMDGYPDGISPLVLASTSEEAYRIAVTAFFATRDDATLPEMGWPWPWEDSQTTDYAYAFDDGKVHASCFGHAWFDPHNEEPDHDESKPTIFPQFDKGRMARPGSKRSGIMVIGF